MGRLELSQELRSGPRPKHLAKTNLLFPVNAELQHHLFFHGVAHDVPAHIAHTPGADTQLAPIPRPKSRAQASAVQGPRREDYMEGDRHCQRDFAPAWERERIRPYRKELPGRLLRSVNPQSGKSFVSLVVCLFDLLARRVLLMLVHWEVLTMSTELVIVTCPVCGGDGTSVASNGELYCVDCNRIYLVLESHGSEYGLAPKPADSLHNVLPFKRAA
jgi:hypothetical protein